MAWDISIIPQRHDECERCVARPLAVETNLCRVKMDVSARKFATIEQSSVTGELRPSLILSLYAPSMARRICLAIKLRSQIEHH